MAYKLAIIGYGGMGEWHHRNIQERIKEIEVVGAYDVRPEQGERAVTAGLKSYVSLEDLLEDESIDIVTIATPNNFHKEIAIGAMQHGKHVICEKPVMMNANELEEVMAVQKQTGKLFSIHQNRRWDRDYRIIKEIVDKNRIGKPYYIESRVQGSRRALHGWRGYKVNGGGMLFDWGVHLIDQMLELISSPAVEINGFLLSIYSEEVDDNFKLMIRFETGEVALIEVATNCFINQPRWHICCKDGTAVVEDWDCKGKIIGLHIEEEIPWDNEIVYTEAGPTRTMAPRPVHTTKEEALPTVETDWSDYYRNIVGVIKGTEELIVKPEQALRVMKVIDYVFESQQKGKKIMCHI